MATTTNYGWTTPDDTALVKDGAAAIRTLGSSVDTTTKNLNPETTLGDIAYRSSTANVNTRLPLGTAGQVLKVNSGATAPEWATDATGMTNPMTTTADTIYSSSGSTPARLGIGTAGQVLTVNSGATAPEWANVSVNRLTLLSTTTLSGATTTISSIPGTYTDLYAIFYGLTGSANARPQIAPNGTTTITNQKNADGSTLQAENTTYLNPGFTTLSSNADNSFFLTIFNYASTSTYKGFQLCGGSDTAGGFSIGVIETTSAITSLVFSRSSGTQSAGTVLLYGVK